MPGDLGSSERTEAGHWEVGRETDAITAPAPHRAASLQSLEASFLAMTAAECPVTSCLSERASCGTLDVVKNKHAVALGRLGGPKGAAARALSLSPERRREIARAAAQARWNRRLPELLRPLFWQYRFEDVRLPAAIDEVMLHVLAYGRPEHLNWLRTRFGDDAIREWIRARQGRGLTRAQMAPWISDATATRWQADDPNARLWEDR
jgi:hypothetical protein